MYLWRCKGLWVTVYCLGLIKPAFGGLHLPPAILTGHHVTALQARANYAQRKDTLWVSVLNPWWIRTPYKIMWCVGRKVGAIGHFQNFWMFFSNGRCLKIGGDASVRIGRLSVSWHINFHNLTECGDIQSDQWWRQLKINSVLWKRVCID